MTEMAAVVGVMTIFLLFVSVILAGEGSGECPHCEHCRERRAGRFVEGWNAR